MSRPRFRVGRRRWVVCVRAVSGSSPAVIPQAGSLSFRYISQLFGSSLAWASPRLLSLSTQIRCNQVETVLGSPDVHIGGFQVGWGLGGGVSRPILALVDISRASQVKML
uniref:Uncharacterized protein n=1 Tax=Rhodosorus marinus TaxID=101924 RepID=A0A7S2ZB07_9RHOD